MSWNLKGNYVETCSCELMCPCNLSFDHGATYDFCRVVFAFAIREGEIEGILMCGVGAIVSLAIFRFLSGTTAKAGAHENYDL